MIFKAMVLYVLLLLDTMDRYVWISAAGGIFQLQHNSHHVSLYCNLILLLVKSERMTYIQTQGNYKQAELLSKIP